MRKKYMFEETNGTNEDTMSETENTADDEPTQPEKDAKQSLKEFQSAIDELSEEDDSCCC